MSKNTNDKWALNTAVSRELTKELTALASVDAWWKDAVNIMVGMVIQLLARRQLSCADIAVFVGCPAECVDLISAHYRHAIEHYANEHKQLTERIKRNAGKK